MIAVAASLLLAASGCGESKADKEAAAYADSFCTSISGWEQQVTGIAARLDAGNPKSVARAKLDQAATATVGLVAKTHKLDVRLRQAAVSSGRTALAPRTSPPWRYRWV